MADKVYFFTFLPDDYHGAPEFADVSDSGRIPKIPTKMEVYRAWKDAGYNTWSNGDWEDGYTERQCFEDYGNSEFYYAVYMMVTDDPKILENDNWGIPVTIAEESGYDEGSEDFKYVTPEMICELIQEEYKNVKLIIPIMKKNG